MNFNTAILWIITVSKSKLQIASSHTTAQILLSAFWNWIFILLFLGVVRASNIFPILSAILLLMGGVCIAASRFYKSKRNIILGAGILFVAAGQNIEYSVFGYMCLCLCVYFCVFMDWVSTTLLCPFIQGFYIEPWSCQFNQNVRNHHVKQMCLLLL